MNPLAARRVRAAGGHAVLRSRAAGRALAHWVRPPDADAGRFPLHEKDSSVFTKRQRSSRRAGFACGAAFASVMASSLVGGGPVWARQEGEAPPPPPEVSTPGAPEDAPASPAPATPPDPAGAGGGGAASSADGRRYLLLPDISLIGIFNGHVSSDKRDQDRDKLRLDEAEIGIQSYVYPGIRADAFIVFADGEAVVEEGFLTVQNLGIGKLPLSATVGRRKVPFGRVNQLHPHSWLYVVQPYALSNLVSGESLTGDGAYLSYLLPTRFFAQLDAGFWSLSESPEDFETGADPSEGVVTSPGAGIADKFTTLRLWTGFPAGGGELEIGGSLARGRGLAYDLPGEGGDGVETVSETLALSRRGLRRTRQVGVGGTVRPTVQLSGLDLSYRRAGRGASRFLLRGEYVQHRQKDAGFRSTAAGYYVLADQRLDARNEVGLRYDWSEFPYAPGLHESAVSLIGTRQLTEQTYLRLQLIRGNRPGKDNFNEAWFQWVWGVGPHTHNLE
jgi:hypothetical protein